MKVCSLFAGIGGFDLAAIKNGFEVVWVNEWNKYACDIYENNFKVRPDERDITTISTDEIPDHDILVGGFPCQAFSIAGKRQGFSETRGTLFFDIARILKDKRPRYFLLENVKGLLSHDGGKTFSTILGVLTDLGYIVEWQVLNSKNFGVPQNRERVFIVGYLRGERSREIFPLRGHNPEANGKTSSTTIDANYWKGIDNHGQRTMIEITKNVSDAQRIYDTNGIAKTLKGLGGGMGAKTGLYAVPLKFLNRNQRNYQGNYSFTLDSAQTGGILKDKRIRRLTPIECERLQTVPDNYTSAASDSQRYKMLGNGWTIDVIAHILSYL